MFKNILTPQKKQQPILEDYTLGEFTFGFELEAWFNTANRTRVRQWTYDYWGEAANNLKLKDPSTLKSNLIDTKNMEFKDDGSINVDRNFDIYDDCERCGGDGALTCPSCNGDGKKDCPDCNGDGFITFPCDDCDNGTTSDGESCEVCNGDGEVSAECETCDGTGAIICQECDGYAESECYVCGGRGEVRMDDVSEAAYEFASPVLRFTVDNLNKVFKFLKEGVNKGYINTNESCGFHVHIGFPNKYSRSEDIFWVLSHLVLDEKMFNNIIMLNDIELFTKNGEDYASLELMETLKYRYERLMERVEYETETDFGNVKDAEFENYEEDFLFEAKKYTKAIEKEIEVFKYEFEYVVKKVYNDEKYSAFRQHPQGTLEWRGPRGFMDAGNIELIKKFIMGKLYPFVKWISKTLSEDYLVFNNKLKISHHAFNAIIKEFETPSPREYQNKKRKFINSMPSMIKAYTSRNEDFIRKYNIENGRIRDLSGDLFLSDAKITPKKDKNFQTDSVLKFCDIKDFIIDLPQKTNARDEAILQYCSLQECVIKNAFMYKGGVEKSSVHNGNFIDMHCIISSVHGGSFDDVHFADSEIFGGKFRNCNVSVTSKIINEVLFFDSRIYLSSGMINKKINVAECILVLRDYMYEKDKIILKETNKMHYAMSQIKIKVDKPTEFGKAIMDYCQERYSGEVPELKEGQSVEEYIRRYAL